MRAIFYQGSYPFTYYLVSVITGDSYEVSEDEFFSVVGYDRSLVPMHYNRDNVNRQDFFLDGDLIGYRIR